MNSLLHSLRRRRVQRRELWAGALNQIGRALPGPSRKWLSLRHARLAHLRSIDGPFYCKYLGEFQVQIDVRRSGIEREMACGTYEKKLRRGLRFFLKSGETVVDVGANVGALTLYFAQAVGPGGRVIAFEPGPVFSERLNANLAVNGLLERVEIHRVGLAEKSGWLRWQEDPLFLGNASLLGEAGIPVPVFPLDAFSLRRCDWIKIDVEGMEGEVLRGAEETLSRFRPKILFESTLEFETIRSAPVRAETEKFLRARGYRLFSLGSRGQLEEVAYPKLAAMTLALPESL